MSDRLAYCLLLVVAVEAAVWECFLVPAHPHLLAPVLAGLGNLGLGWAAGQVLRGGGIGPGICWLLIALILSTRGPLGDLIVPANGWGVTFLVAGIAGAAAGLGRRGDVSATPSGQSGR